MIHRLRHRVRRHTISFKHAFDGVRWALSTQPNYMVHLSLSLLTVLGAIYYHIETYEWLILIFVISVGLAIETLNSALEQALDCVSREIRHDIKVSKDAAAAAMFLFSLGAFTIACVIFLPRILHPL